MTRIKEAHTWLADTLGGDTPRANSLLRIGQDHGLLTNSGRGRGSPYLALTDFASLPCMALMTEGPTKAPQVVQRLWDLPLSMVTADLGDGRGDLGFEPKHLDVVSDLLGPCVRRYLGKHGGRDLYIRDTQRPTNLISTLTVLFDLFAPLHDFHAYDTIELEQAEDRLAVKLSLHGPRYGVQPDGWRGEGEDAYRLVLTFGDLVVFSGRSIETRRTLRSEALNALAVLNRTEWVLRRLALRSEGEGA